MPSRLTIIKFDISLLVKVTKDNILLEFVYSKALFTADTMERFAQLLVHVLHTCSNRPELELSKLSLLSGEEKTDSSYRKMLQDTEDTAKPTFDTMIEWFESTAKRMPNQTALVCGEDRWSFSELNTKANRLAKMPLENGFEEGVPHCRDCDGEPTGNDRRRACCFQSGRCIPAD